MATNNVPNLSPPKVNTLVAESTCYTRRKMNKFRQKWIIEHFSSYDEIQEEITSSTFPPRPNDELEWCLKMYPRGEIIDSVHFVSLFLHLVSCNKSEVHAKFKFGILCAKRETTKILVTETQRTLRFVQDSNWGYENFIKRDYLLNEANGLLLNDKLTIFCEVSVMMDSINIPGRNTIKLKVPKCGLLDDFGLLFENQKLTDVTFVVQGKHFKQKRVQAHKAILAARSPVFSAMFEHKMQEKTNNCVEITDIGYKVLREMLRFIYTGKVANLEKIAYDLLTAADKYALKRLKVICEEALCTSLTIENAVEILVLADLHGADQLKTQAINFIRTNATDVISTGGFKSLANTYPYLLVEALQSISPIEPPRKRVKRIRKQ